MGDSLQSTPTGRSPLLRALSAGDVRELILGECELALIDLRETGIFGRGHILFAISLPLSRLELRIDDFVPRRNTPIVLCAGAADDELVRRAARRLGGFGYPDLAYLQGGIEAWAAAGFEVFSGVNVPSKAFGELVERTFKTPHVTANELQTIRDGGDDLVIVDSRPMKEFRKMNIPGGINVPGAELVYRIHDIAPDPATTVVVNCAGRTRSIIGAQSLINAGVPNRVVALENGTSGWHLAGLELERGQDRAYAAVSEQGRAWARQAARNVARRFGVPTVDAATVARWRGEPDRTVYLLDVRDPSEYRAGHLPGSRSAPGGQLVQATDEYLAVRGARLVLIDDDGVRATMTASWLIQMGWKDVHVLQDALIPGAKLETGRRGRVIPGLDQARPKTVSAPELSRIMEGTGAVVVDLADSLGYREGHVPGAWFAIRAHMPGNLNKLPDAPVVVLTSPHGILARLAAADARGSGRAVRVLDGGTGAWRRAGLPLEEGFSHMADDTDDRWYKPYDLDEGSRERMASYLHWEVNLVDQIARDGTARFRLPAGR